MCRRRPVSGLNSRFLSVIGSMPASRRFNVNFVIPMLENRFILGYLQLKNACIVIHISLLITLGFRRNTSILILRPQHHGKKSSIYRNTFCSIISVTLKRRSNVRHVTERSKPWIGLRANDSKWDSASNATKKKRPMWDAGWHVIVKSSSSQV